ncbi:hypothetical protein GCM10027612_82720 [Microbispora bryophytorum subsp. camponoti]
MWSRPVRNAGVPTGMANRSRNPAIAAASAPSTPRAISHFEPSARNPGPGANRDARSKTMLATHAPMGTATSMGWNGWPYGPASAALTGRFASCSSPVIRTSAFDILRQTLLVLFGWAVKE